VAFDQTFRLLFAMNIIDHRILIPASQDKVWHHISDVTANVNWQVDCKSVSILTTMRFGSGLRWRYTSQNGKEYVVEVTAWYDRLGYEYRIVDGVSYKSNKGIIRLQELPEGTVVQWTFTYEPAGFIGGLQNSLSTKRRIEKEMIDSLRMLYRYIGKSPEVESLQTKSLMREAPDVESRARYKPRHPSILEEKQVTPPTQPSPAVEPIMVEEDTRPNPAITVTGIKEPDFLSDLPVSPSTADTEERFKPPATEPIKTPPPFNVEKPALEAAPTFELPQIKDTSEVDTSKISVFEIFGLPKPSETQEIKAISPGLLEESVETSVNTSPLVLNVSPAPAAIYRQRMGRRILMRHTSIRLRRPS
jgi:uncharacterized membrane protein